MAEIFSDFHKCSLQLEIRLPNEDIGKVLVVRANDKVEISNPDGSVVLVIEVARPPSQ